MTQWCVTTHHQRMYTFERDVLPARWIRQRLHPFGQDVGSVIPDTFQAYVRIFHPAYAAGRPVRWRDVAAAAGRVAHPLMQFGNIAGDWRASSHPEVWTSPPRTGTLTEDLAATLAGALRRRTATPDRCWFLIWEGWGGIAAGGGAIPRFEIPGRRYLLRAGSIETATHSVDPPGYQSASMWWPDDRAWFVSTEVDFEYSYVGGTRECIARLLADPDIEAFPAACGDDPSYASDAINPAPGRYR